jgi:hypothetical protein
VIPLAFYVAHLNCRLPGCCIIIQDQRDMIPSSLPVLKKTSECLGGARKIDRIGKNRALVSSKDGKESPVCKVAK